MSKFVWPILVLVVACIAVRPASADIVDISFSTNGIESWDEQNSPFNYRTTADLGAGSASYHIIGIGWNVNLTAFGTSWLSEFVLGFLNRPVYLLPGRDVDSPGTGTFSSFGVVDLIPLGLDWTQTSHLVNLEYFEDLDDEQGEVDGMWNFGTITMRVERFGAIPEPGFICLLGLSCLGLMARRSGRD